MNYDDIRKQADYYLNNDTTMSDAASVFGISKKTFQTNMKRLASFDMQKYILVKDKKERNLALGASKGGKNGVPTSHVLTHKIQRKNNISDEEIISIAKQLLDNDWTLREAEEHLGISKSTLNVYLSRKILGDELFEKITLLKEFHRANTNKPYEKPNSWSKGK